MAKPLTDDHACQGRGPGYLSQRCDKYGAGDAVRYASDVHLWLCSACWCATPPAGPWKAGADRPVS